MTRLWTLNGPAVALVMVEIGRLLLLLLLHFPPLLLLLPRTHPLTTPL